MIYKGKIFEDSEIRGKDFEGDIFESCKFIGEIKFVNFLECKFTSCDFSIGLYNTTSFVRCSFPDSKLSNIDFSDIRIDNCNFSNSVMENCIFKSKKKFNLKNEIFSNTNLTGTAFVLCNLEKQTFEGCDLTSCAFERCNLKETNFVGAKIDGVGFEDCNIEKTILDVNGFISYGNSKGFVLNN